MIRNICAVLLVCVCVLSACAVSPSFEDDIAASATFSPATCLGHYDHENRGRKPVYRSRILPDCAAYVSDAEILVRIPIYHGDEPFYDADPSGHFVVHLKRVVEISTLALELKDKKVSFWALSILEGDQQWGGDEIVVQVEDPHDAAGMINSHSAADSVLNVSDHAIRLHASRMPFSANSRPGMHHLSLVVAVNEQFLRRGELPDSLIGLWQQPPSRWSWTKIDSEGDVYHCHKNLSGRVHQMFGRLVGNLFVWGEMRSSLDPEIVKLQESEPGQSAYMVEITEWGDYAYLPFQTYPIEDCDEQ